MATPLQDALQSLLGSAFEIRRELSGGGMSRVFVAYETALKREVAVKVLPPDLVSAKSVARFRTEIQVTAQLQHPHILPVATAGGNERLLFYIVPFVAGGSLRDSLAAGRAPSFTDGVRIASELLGAVAFAHERGIIHRDIKPGNVLLSEGHAILADFGIARALEAIQEAEPQSASSVATPEQYLAPERPRDSAADLYAVAVLTHEMLTGVLPEPDVSVESVDAALRVRHGDAERVQTRAVAQVLSRALTRDPSRRFTRAVDFRAAFTTPGSAGQVRRGRALAASAAVVMVAALIAWSLLRGRAVPSAGVAPPPSDTSRLAASPVVAESAVGTTRAMRAPAPHKPDTVKLVSARPKPATMSVFDSAMAARDRDDLRAARDLFDRVPAGSRQYAIAQLRVAMHDGWSWSPQAIESATRAALLALGLRDSLDAEQIALGEGMVALGRGQYVEACGAFDAARAIKESFDSWMGAAECRVRDSLVTVDSAGTQRFRSSLYEAARAYLEAGRHGSTMSLNVAYNKLTTAAYTEPTRVRRGRTADGRGVLGVQTAVADSFTMEIVPPGPRRVTPDGVQAQTRSVIMARQMLRPAFVTWTTRDPTNARARELLVDLLEIMGFIREADSDGVTALGEIEAARRIPASDDVMPVRLARTHVRILVKSRDFARAARLADSLLEAASGEVANAQADALVGLAMLTGRVQRATTLLQQVVAMPGRDLRGPDGRPVEFQPAVLSERAAFVVRSTLGVCDNDLRAAPARLEATLDAMFPNASRPRGVEATVIERPLLTALPCLGLDGIRVLREPLNPFARALTVPADQVRSQLDAAFASLTRAREVGGPRVESAENSVTEAFLRLSVRDTASAQVALGLVLDALPAQPTFIISNEVIAGSLVRAMVMRADIAAAQGDKALAREWASAVVALWGKADAELQPVVQRMRALSN